MSTKLGRVMTYHKELPPITSHDPLNMYSREVTWQIKTAKLTYHIAYSHQTFQGGEISLRSYILYDALYFQLHKTNEHETKQSDDLPCEAPTLKVRWPYVGHVKSW